MAYEFPTENLVPGQIEEVPQADGSVVRYQMDGPSRCVEDPQYRRWRYRWSCNHRRRPYNGVLDHRQLQTHSTILQTSYRPNRMLTGIFGMLSLH